MLRDLVTDPLSLLAYDAFILDAGKGKPMTSLEQKLQLLNLAAMSHQIEQDCRSRR